MSPWHVYWHGGGWRPYSVEVPDAGYSGRAFTRRGGERKGRRVWERWRDR